LERFRAAAPNALPVLPSVVSPGAANRDSEDARSEWDIRLREIEPLIRDRRFPEAKMSAQRMLLDPNVPPTVFVRATELSARATDEIRQTFEGIVTGSTKNKVQKRTPSDSDGGYAASGPSADEGAG